LTYELITRPEYISDVIGKMIDSKDIRKITEQPDPIKQQFAQEQIYLVLEQRMKRVAGETLTGNIYERLNNPIDWFYTPNKSLGNKRPYDECKSGGKRRRSVRHPE
jgi:hypothetical protein